MSGTTYVAWEDPVTSWVDLCILPASASGCEGGAPVQLTDSSHYNSGNFSGPGAIVVLPNGNVVVIGTPTSTGSIAWESSPSGAAFLTAGQGLQNGGVVISPVSLFYAFNNAVELSSTDVGLLDDYFDQFSDSVAIGPESPTPPAKTNQTSPAGEFPRKALDAAGPELAAEPAPPPASPTDDVVVGVGDNFGGPPAGLPGCLNSAGTGYGVSVGQVNGTSKAAGTLNAEGLPGYGVLACSAEAPVLAQGGKDGIGELEEEGNGVDGAGSTFTINYHPFFATATGGAFETGVQLADVTSQVLDGVNSTDLSEDSGTGVYAAWTDDQGLVLDYSANGGTSWGPPVVVPAPASGFGNPLIAGVGGGNVLIAFESNPGTGTQTFLEQVNYQALLIAPDTLTTSQTSGTTTDTSITVPAGTTGETDRAFVSGANASAATGTVDYGLFSNSDCRPASLVFNGGTEAVSGDDAGASAGVGSALAPGKYYWEAAYSGDALNEPSASACGSEVLTVVPAATVGGGGSISSTTVTITVTCAMVPSPSPSRSRSTHRRPRARPESTEKPTRGSSRWRPAGSRSAARARRSWRSG